MGCCYAGSTISSYTLGRLADIGGWQMVMNLLLIISIFSILIGIIGGKLGRNTENKILQEK